METLRIDRERLQRRLELDEGYRALPYQCTSKKWTVGIGRNLDDVGLSNEEMGMLFGRVVPQAQIRTLITARGGINRAEAYVLLWNDAKRAVADLDRYFSWWRTLDGVRQEALINMCFQLGIGSLRKFVNTMRYLEAGQYGQAASNMLRSLWARQTPKRCHRVSEQIRTGVPQ